MVLNYDMFEDLATIDVEGETYRIRYLMLYDNKEKIRVDFNKIYTRYGGKFTGLIMPANVYKREKYVPDGSVYIIEKGKTIVKGCKSCILYMPKTLVGLTLINKTNFKETYSIFNCTSYMFDKSISD